ncbi:MAG: hypothetical protein ACRYFS_03045 [Janthinobacterium lividum]
MAEIWTEDEIAVLSRKFNIRPCLRLHSQAEDYHFPRRLFLSDGYSPPGGYVKDFGVISHEERLHLFHIDGRPGEVCWITGNEISFGHASTSDFQHWIRHPMPLAVGQHSWESEHVWAPYVYKRGEIFYLFYMGSGQGQAFISYATSRDLETWERWEGGPITCAAGRDPHVFDHLGQTILLYTSHSAAAVSASVTSDMVDWEALPDILTIPGRAVVESAALHPLNGGYVLWFNDYGDNLAGFRAAYALSNDALHFDADSIREFVFQTDHSDAVPSLELPVSAPLPLSIELIARGEQIWLVCYFRWHGDRNRLFFGTIDWSDDRAIIREITNPAQLESSLASCCYSI